MFRKLTLICSATALAAACATGPFSQQPAENERGVVITDDRRDRDYDRYPDDDYERAPDRTFASDDRIHDDIHRALEREGMHGVSVRVENGDVYLTGQVRSRAEKQRAHDVAHDISGVNRVYFDDIRIS